MICVYIFGCGIGADFDEKKAETEKKLVKKAIKEMDLLKSEVVSIIVLPSQVEIMGISETGYPMIIVEGPDNDPLTTELKNRLLDYDEISEFSIK